MSRVAKNPVKLPKGVDVTISPSKILVKGPKGALEQMINAAVLIQQQVDDAGDANGSNVLTFTPRDGSNNANAQAGTARALVNNMVTGVTEGFKIELSLVGVGYRAQAKGSVLGLSLGFSHPVDYTLPAGVSAATPTPTQIILEGIDKQKLGQVAAEIRAYRPPEPYKGKGIRYSSENVIIKETKKK